MAVDTENEHSLISVPVKVLLTEAGIKALTAKGNKIRRYLLSDASEETGIQLADFTPPTLQKMIVLGYVGKVEMPLHDVVATRRDVLDFAKLVTYAMLYRQFDTAVYNAIIHSNLVHYWNRHNPKKPIDFKTKVNTAYLRSVLAKNAHSVAQVRRTISDPVSAEIEQNPALQGDERRVQQLLMGRFLDQVSPLSWFLLTVYAESQPAEMMINEIREILQNYLQKAVIGEYLGLMILELLGSMRREGQDRTVYVLWKFNRRKDSQGDRQRLHIALSNDAERFREVKHKVHLRVGIDVGEKSLQDFYSAEGQSDVELNLGLYYLSFLNDACNKLNVLFESFVNKSARTGETLVNLVLTF
jgi:hypothetical protein